LSARLAGARWLRPDLEDVRESALRPHTAPSAELASDRSPANGVTVITSVAVPNRNDNPERIALPSGGVYIWIFEYGRVHGDFPRRPRTIELGTEEMHTCGFGEGYMVLFKDHGRLLQIFVRLGSHADQSLVLEVLDSLRVTRRAAAA
jgi:hypothetical protein